MPEIDIRIFGVPERIENIRHNQELLNVPEDRVVIDHAHTGCFAAAQRAWSIPTTADHVLVLQDDVVLSNGFAEICRIMAETHPDAIIGLYPGQFPRAEHIKGLPLRSPYIATHDLAGPAVLMPSRYIFPCLITWDSKRRGDDVQIQIWAHDNGIRLLTTIPCIVQHIGEQSVFQPGRNLGGTDFFTEDPSDIDWRSTYISRWRNIAYR